MQAERERLAREQLMREQMRRQAEGRVAELEREILGLRGHVERDQMMLEQYDRVGRNCLVYNKSEGCNGLVRICRERVERRDDVLDLI